MEHGGFLENGSTAANLKQGDAAGRFQARPISNRRRKEIEMENQSVTMQAIWRKDDEKIWKLCANGKTFTITHSKDYRSGAWFYRVSITQSEWVTGTHEFEKYADMQKFILNRA